MHVNIVIKNKKGITLDETQSFGVTKKIVEKFSKYRLDMLNGFQFLLGALTHISKNDFIIPVGFVKNDPLTTHPTYPNFKQQNTCFVQSIDEYEFHVKTKHETQS